MKINLRPKSVSKASIIVVLCALRVCIFASLSQYGLSLISGGKDDVLTRRPKKVVCCERCSALSTRTKERMRMSSINIITNYNGIWENRGKYDEM